jgi:chorismate synthase
LRFLTAGESHGPALVTIVEGLPAGLAVSAEAIDCQLRRRMHGYGRGARMKIESDAIEWLGGVRAGETLGSPVSMRIVNRDWANWEDVMSPEGAGEIRRRRVTRPRPGHADLVGVLKYDRLDARDILERASARETAARVAAGALARRLLEEFGVEIGSHVVSLGGVRSSPAALPVPLNEVPTSHQVRMLDKAAESEAMRRIDAAKDEGNTLGGEVEVVVRGVPLGLGSHTHWDRKLDARPRRQPDVHSRGEGCRDGAWLRGRPADRAPRCTIRSRRARFETRGVDSSGSATTPAGSRVA